MCGARPAAAGPPARGPGGRESRDAVADIEILHKFMRTTPTMTTAPCINHSSSTEALRPVRSSARCASCAAHRASCRVVRRVGRRQTSGAAEPPPSREARRQSASAVQNDEPLVLRRSSGALSSRVAPLRAQRRALVMRAGEASQVRNISTTFHDLINCSRAPTPCRRGSRSRRARCGPCRPCTTSGCATSQGACRSARREASSGRRWCLPGCT